jgi:hypothetical protein
VLCHFDKKNTPKIIRLHLVKDELIAVWKFQEILTAII